jgi:DNA oxidative demethylase
MINLAEGLIYFPNFLTQKYIDNILNDLRKTLKQAPFFTPKMPKTGKDFSVKMTNMGSFGWVCDKEYGYRYQSFHPQTGKKWPLISKEITDIWHNITKIKAKPDCCLVNYYNKNAKMGLHVDRDEKDFSYPVLSISIGASALFRFGGLKRSDKTKSIKLNNGDIIILSGKSRLIYHGIDKIYQDNNFDYRLNLTLRKI